MLYKLSGFKFNKTVCNSVTVLLRESKYLSIFIWKLYIAAVPSKNAVSANMKHSGYFH